MFLTVVTVAVSYVDVGPFNLAVALLVAVAKATLVVLFFMHVKYRHPLVWLSVFAGFFWLGIMFVFLFSDYLTRIWDPPAPVEFLKLGVGF